MIQILKTGKKPHFQPDLGRLGPILERHFFFQKSGFISL